MFGFLFVLLVELFWAFTIDIKENIINEMSRNFFA
jgi:hypothetical protein